MKKYCLDMSGISTPLEMLPVDTYVSIWVRVMSILESGVVAVTTEIYDEMCNIVGPVGDCIRANQEQLVLEVAQDGWDWQTYISHSTQMQITYEDVISEFNGDRKNTICLNDVSIIALGKTLRLPVISMEANVQKVSDTKKRIPEVCGLENVVHYDFNEFLRKERIKL
jgi:hypothetical protein